MNPQARILFLGALLAAAACEKDPKVCATKYNLRITDGFRSQGGVLISESHFLTPLTLVANIDDIQATAPDGGGLKAKVIKRDPKVGAALVRIRGKKLAGSSIGEATELEPGAQLTTFLPSASGTGEIRTGRISAWVFHEGRAYMQTDLDVTPADLGLGVFGENGKLVGLMALHRGKNLSYVLPIEYLTQGDGAVAIHPDTMRVIDKSPLSEAFAAKSQEAAKHTDPLPTPVTFEMIRYMQAFSKTALVGTLTMLDSKANPSHTQPIQFKIEAIDASRNRRQIAAGTLDTANIRWHAPPEFAQQRRSTLVESFGETYAKQYFDPYLYGELRYRLPFAPFCKDVSDTEVHVMVLTLEDNRTSGEIEFSDLVNICKGEEEGEGTRLEEAWGMSAPAPENHPSAPQVENQKEKKKTRTKKSKRLKHKKRRRR
ncbi:MAG: serine protease [Myxococcota bacterium]